MLSETGRDELLNLLQHTGTERSSAPESHLAKD